MLKRSRFAQESRLFPTVVNQGVDDDAGRVSWNTHRGRIHFSGATPGFRTKARLVPGSRGIFVGLT